MLGILTHLIENFVPSSRYVPYILGLVVVFAIRTYAAGHRSTQERTLAGQTFILIGAFSGEGLALFHALATRGAQVVALHPDPEAPAVQQLVHLLRETTSNERLYADRCNVTSVASIRAFVQTWDKEARGGMVGDLATRIEAVVFCHGDGDGLEQAGLALGRQSIGEGELYHTTLATTRHALLQLLLPALLTSAASSPVRIISSVSPWYSTGSLLLDDLDYTTRSYPSYQPWVAEGSATLASIALMNELQKRVDEGGKARLAVLSVCGGFTRGYWRKILRASPAHPHFSLAGFLVYMFTLPITFLLCKTADQASQGLLDAVLGEIKREKVVLADAKEEVKKVQRYDEEGDPIKDPIQLVSGSIYREGNQSRIPALEDEKLGAKLWAIESKTVARLVAEAEKQEKVDKAAADAKAASQPKDKEE